MSGFKLFGAGAREDLSDWTSDGAAPPRWAGELSPYERAYCSARRRPVEHAAGRIAAKKAVALAVSRAGGPPIDPADIEIAAAAPLVAGPPGLSTSRRPVCRARDPQRHDLDAVLVSVSVSISHTHRAAVAAAIMVVATTD
jgi:phosphopantetheinyl transferase (holo-ACP synthase)